MRWKLLFALPFFIGIAIWESAECIHILDAGDAPVVEGIIVEREEFRRWGGIPAGKLTVELAGETTTVIARTNKTAMEELPERVRFQYTGDPKREVFIEGEENPFWVALFLWLVSGGIVAFWVARVRSRSLGPEAIDTMANVNSPDMSSR
jgi:hypothetical protein